MKGSAVLFYILLVLGLPAGSASSDADDAYALIKSKIDAVVLVLQHQGDDERKKKDEVINIIMPVFDMPLMAKLAVGGTFWPRFSGDEKARFSVAFEAMLQNAYIDRIMRYSDEKIVFKAPVDNNKKVYVPVDLISAGDTYEMIYKLYRSNATWKIYDVEIEGVSIIKSYRSQINQVLSTGTFEDLLQKMEGSMTID